MTVRPALERSSATTLWISAHCSACAPGGASQRICQSPWTDLAAPWALAADVSPKNDRAARLKPNQRLPLAANRLAWIAALPVLCCEGPIGVDPFDISFGYVLRQSIQ